MLQALKDMLQATKDLIASKKFQTVAVALVVAAGAKFGLSLDPVMVMSVLGLFAVLIHAQGQADLGKEAAMIAAASSLPPVGEVVTEKKAQSGSAALIVIVAMGTLIGVVIAVTACTASQKAEVKAAGSALIDCAKTDFLNAVPDIAGVVFSGTDVASKLEALGVKAGEQTLACGVKTVLAVLQAAPGHAAPSPGVISAQAYADAKHWQYK